MTTRPKTPKGLKPKDLIGLPWRLAFMLQEMGWHLRTEVIWHKPNAMPESALDRPQRSHEYLFLFSKSKKYYFDRSILDDRSAEDVDTQRSVWAVSAGSGGSGHKAAFPVRLITPCVLSSTKKGDIVLDPFSGSASVGIACIQNYRRFIGIELNSKYSKLADLRMSAMFEHYRFNGHAAQWKRALRGKGKIPSR
jgi:site-specific DNA-methyltransferase (adenine-specific)